MPPADVVAGFSELHELWASDPPRQSFRFTEVPGANGLKTTHPNMTREWVGRSLAYGGLQIADLELLENNDWVTIAWDRTTNGRAGDLNITPAGTAFVTDLGDET